MKAQHQAYSKDVRGVPCKRNVKFPQNTCDVVVIVDKLQKKAKRSGWYRVVDYPTSGTREFSSSVSQVFSDKHESSTPPYVTVKPYLQPPVRGNQGSSLNPETGCSN